MYPVYKGMRVIYEFADDARKDEKKCGPHGRYFKEDLDQE